ncbi:MAG: magnesium transporter, partial [Pseudolabrys sp.]
MLDQEQTNGAEAAQLPRNKDGSIRKTFVKSVARRIETGDGTGLRALVGDLHESDMGALIEALPPEQRQRLVELLGIDFDFTALTEVDDAVREEILEELPSQAVAKGVSELESDDAVAILEDLPKDEQAEILEQLPQTERVALTRSLDYPEESAGRRMQTEFIAVPPDWNVGQAIDYMRETTELP